MPDREPPPPPPPPPSGIARLRADLAGPRGHRRIEALLSADDPAAAVAALSPVEIYELVHEVGFEETADLIALATPEQVRGCLDIEVWDRDHAQIELARPWLAVLCDVGFEKLGEVWAGLDPELRALILQRQTIIYDLTLGEEPDEADERPILYTVDRFFAIIILGDEDTMRLVHQLVDDLYRADDNLARHTLMSARSEPPAELEEQSYRWRAGRLADLGFVDFYEALDLFKPLDADAVHIGEGSHERFPSHDPDAAPRNLPAVIAEQVVSRSFLARAMDRLARGDAERLEQAILVLVNKVMSAARVKPGDMEALRRGAHYATATVSLGLETVARGDLDRAAHALSTVSLTRLHRVGHTLTLKLARLAKGLAPRAATAALPASAVIAGLTAARPWLARVIDTPPAAGIRPFESQTDLRRVAELLARLTLRIALVEGLGVNLVAMGQLPEPRPALDDHIRTAMVRAMIGGELSGDALTTEEVLRFRTGLRDGEVTEDARRTALAAVLARLDAARIGAGGDALPAMVSDWVADIERALGAIDDDEIDARYVDGVILQTARS